MSMIDDDELFQTKTDLTEREKVVCYIANRFSNTHQHVLAMICGVNSGRVSEAICAIEYAAKNTKEIYELYKKQKLVGGE